MTDSDRRIIVAQGSAIEARRSEQVVAAEQRAEDAEAEVACADKIRPTGESLQKETWALQRLRKHHGAQRNGL